MVTLKRLSRPPIIKPADVAGSGVGVCGEIIAIEPSPVSNYKQDMLRMKHASGREFLFPATAVIERALNAEFATLEKSVGQTIVIRGAGRQLTADKQRNVNLFEVFVVQK